MEVTVNIDGTGLCQANSPIGFLNHMVDQLASHGLFDVTVSATGDTWIDDHHTNEDIGLALGTALAQALGDRKGIHRFGDFTGGGAVARGDRGSRPLVLTCCSCAWWRVRPLAHAGRHE